MIKIVFLFCALWISTGTALLAQSEETVTKDSTELSTDTLTTDKGLFSRWYRASGVSPAADIRAEDGLFLGLTFKSKENKNSEQRDSDIHSFTALHSLSTKSFILKYRSEWVNVFRNTDVTINALADITGNILNYYGLGNNTPFKREGDHGRFYRVNFSYYLAEPALRFNLRNKVTLTVGPSFQYYSNGSNNNRFIATPEIINSYDNIFSDKAHGGAALVLGWDKRNDILVPTRGFRFELRLHGYEGLNDVSDAYAQAYPQFSFFIPLSKKGNLVLAERIGAGFTTGETEFYQSAFLGSQDNLLGFRKHRFAGEHLLYNNLELRFSFADIQRAILPAKMGLIGFYDAGRVWIDNEDSDRIHHGVGAGVYLYPLNRFFVRAIAGYSKEGWQPTVTVHQRF